MSRKFVCLILAVCTLISGIVIVYAGEKASEEAAYENALAALSEAGMTCPSATALSDGRGMALAAELGMLDQRSTMTISQLGAQALLAQQEQQRAAQEEAQQQAQRSAYLALYDGVMMERGTVTVRTKPADDASAARTLSQGKVAKLLDITAEGWYQISFGKTTGYVRAEDCRGVSYADYAGTRAAMDVAAALIDYAYTWLGTPYAYGGSSYSGTDCSGFTMRVFAQLGCSLSHGARDQYRAATPVTTAERAAGDLVFFSGPGSSQIEHVGIYLGGGRFIHASTSGGVIISSLYENYYATYYYGAARVIFE